MPSCRQSESIAVKYPVCLLIGSFLLNGSSAAQATECQPVASSAGVLVEIQPRLYAVSGSPADFNPCHPSVELKMPRQGARFPLVIISHGGAGLGEAERSIASEFRKMGFATLLFDAYKMNGFQQDWRFWAEQVTNESRQRINYKATLGAYQWALTNGDIDTSRIYFHGVSNGANVVVNMAGAVDPAHVKGVIAEGTMMSGIGVPDKLNVPVKLVFGKLDNYGGRQQDHWRWLLKESCMLNGRTQRFIQPAGSAQRCNLDNDPGGSTESPIEWYESQKKAGADIEIWWYEGAAHGIFSGPVVQQTRTWGVANKRYAWIGGSAASRNKFLEDFKNFVQEK